MKILVISDLHIGENARTKELCPYPNNDHKDGKLVSSFLFSVKEYIKDFGNIDYLVIPGDITNRSQLVEFKCANELIESIVSEIKIKKENIICVPGNHDIDWNVFGDSKLYAEEKILRRNQKYNSLIDNIHKFSDYVSRELIKDPFINVWEFSDAVFWGFNSSWHDDAMEEKHCGIIELDHIEILKKKLADYEPKTRNKLKFFILHHHLVQYPNIHPLWKDFSCMQNSQLLLEILSENAFNFVIHGHRHVPYFHSMKFLSYPTINLLCAGSYSCEIPTEIAGSVGNLYHIIDFHDVIKCKGKVYTRAYDSVKSKWVKSKENHGIEYIDSFGNELLFNDLYIKCEQELCKLKKGKFIGLDELIDLFPELKYLQNQAKKRLFSLLENKLSIKHCSSIEDESFFIKK